MRQWSVAGLRVSVRSSTSSLVTRASRRTFTGHAQQKRAFPAAQPQTLPRSDEIFAAPHPSPLPPKRPRPDPYLLLAPELQHLRGTLLDLLGSSHPSLTEIAKYYFLQPSKQLRPLLVLLFSQATNGLGGSWHVKQWAAECEGAGGRTEELDRPLTRADVLNDCNPNMPDHTASFHNSFSLQPPSPPVQPPLPPPPGPLPTQIRLAQIVEMIHVASLLHDDVIDKSPLRRALCPRGRLPPGPRECRLSRLGDSEVVELIASVIANLVEGEILQLNVGRENFDIYLQKTYLKTASLMAKGARAQLCWVWKEVAYAYGRNLGIAFQLVDDILDYEAGEATLGKPGGADLQLGLATGPRCMPGRNTRRWFDQEGDVELVSAVPQLRPSAPIVGRRAYARPRTKTC
ncbi:terpenoid synthase [Amylocystis lapponica]|nr:terpenoid synthase [Amylocystis lapponica]